MGTRCLIYVVDRYNGVHASLYSQFDGYPDQEGGRGWDLYNLLKGRKLCNGIGMNTSYKTHSNGIEDLAALLVWYFKNDSRLGHIYLCQAPKLKSYKKPHELNADDFSILNNHCRERWGEYTYIITEGAEEGSIRIIVFGYNDKLYDGSPDGLAERFGYKETRPLSEEPADEEAA